MSDIDAVGGAITGAVIARAVEPDRGGNDGHTHETACLNCNAMLTGPYCASCGQQAHVHRTLTALWHDIAHGVFHFEGKVWRTLPMLAWRPGDVTRRYIHGERARFISPLALFLFSVFLMFAVFEGVGGPVRPDAARTDVETGNSATAGSELASKLKSARAAVEKLERRRREAIAQRKPTTAIDEELAEARDDASAISATALLAEGVKSDDLITEGFQVDTGSKAFDDRARVALANPKLLLYKLQSSAYKFAWALIPISLPFMWAMFAWRREYRLYDHAVFVTYSLSSVVLLLVAMALIAAIGGPSGLLLLLVPVHFYRQLKQAYQLTLAGALTRTIVMLFASGLVLTLFGILLLALGLSE